MRLIFLVVSCTFNLLQGNAWAAEELLCYPAWYLAGEKEIVAALEYHDEFKKIGEPHRLEVLPSGEVMARFRHGQSKWITHLNRRELGELKELIAGVNSAAKMISGHKIPCHHASTYPHTLYFIPETILDAGERVCDIGCKSYSRCIAHQLAMTRPTTESLKGLKKVSIGRPLNTPGMCAFNSLATREGGAAINKVEWKNPPNKAEEVKTNRCVEKMPMRPLDSPKGLHSKSHTTI